MKNTKPCKVYQDMQDVYTSINDFQSEVLKLLDSHIAKYPKAKLRFMMNKIMVNFPNSWFYINFKYTDKVVIGIGKMPEQSRKGLELMAKDISPTGLIKIDLYQVDEFENKGISQIIDMLAI